jgi:hypothetical protein
METFPNEILLGILLELPGISDIAAWRLVNRRFASIAFDISTRHIAILNTSDCIGRLLATFKGLIPSRKITIYHVPWTDLPRQTSGVHKLLWLDRSQVNGNCFIPEERTWEATDIRRLLGALPQLRTIRFDYPLGRKVVVGYGDLPSPLFWNGGFLPSPSMRTPYWHQDFTKTVSLALSIVNDFPSITDIEINGRFSATESSETGPQGAPTGVPDLRHILGLRIEALNRAGPRDDPAIQSFLLAFGNLQRLRLWLSGPSRTMCCEGLTWRHLSHLELGGLHISSKASVSLFRRHEELRSITMTNVRLQGGVEGWKEFISAVGPISKSWACSYSSGVVHGTMTRDL